MVGDVSLQEVVTAIDSIQQTSDVRWRCVHAVWACAAFGAAAEEVDAEGVEDLHQALR